ncbi:MAG: hypothetical protein JNJ41_18370 [Bacteroidia bacterium]|nr:hypothetical protein [Bacteroidia bacterium]
MRKPFQKVQSKSASCKDLGTKNLPLIKVNSTAVELRFKKSGLQLALGKFSYMKKVVYFYAIIFTGLALSAQNLQIKINNRTGYNVDSLIIGGNYYGFIKKDETVMITENFLFNFAQGSLPGTADGYIHNRHKEFNYPARVYPFCGTWMDHPKEKKDINYITSGKFEYDLLLFEGNYGYRLYYSEVMFIDDMIPEHLIGTYLPLNAEGDKLSAICKEGLLRINEDNTFSYILTHDKTWCPDQKDSTYEGSCIEKNDTLYLSTKNNKQLIEPKFNFTETDLTNEITISFYTE